jgi:crossover junction endodeoxyribonuclease RusA
MRTYLLDLFVPGKPAPQGSAKGFVNPKTGRAIIVKDNAAKQNTWRGDIREQAMAAWQAAPPIPREQPVRLNLTFVMPRPASLPKRKATPPAVKRPDVDKLSRAVCDALTSAGIYTDDSQVVSLYACKRVAEIGEPSGCGITVIKEPI